MTDRRKKPGSKRLVLPVLLAGIAILTLLGARQTGAYWTDVDTVEAGPVSSANLDVQLRAGTSGNFTDTITIPAAALSGMLPGDSRAFSMGVTNASVETPMTYQVFGRAAPSAPPNANYFGNSLQTQIWISNGAANNPGSPATGYRTDQFGTSYGASCSSGTQVGLQTSLSVTSNVLLTASSTNPVPTLQPGAVNNLCVRVSLPNGVSANAMGKSTTLTFTVVARSVER